MKTLTLSLIALALGIAPMKAQIFQPNIVNGAFLGGIAGAIIGNNSGHHTGEGALIGAATGVVLGSLVQPQPAAAYQQPVQVVYTQTAPVVYAQPCAPATAVTYYYPAPVYYGWGWYRSYYGPRFDFRFGFRGGGFRHR